MLDVANTAMRETADAAVNLHGPSKKLGRCEVTSRDVYCESVLLLGTISSTPYLAGLRGTGNSKVRPDATGAALNAVLYAPVRTSAALRGVSAVFSDGITACTLSAKSTKSLLNATAYVKLALVMLPEPISMGSLSSREVTVLRKNLRGLFVADMLTMLPDSRTSRP